MVTGGSGANGLTLQSQVKSLDNAIKKPHNLGKVPHVTELWKGTGGWGGGGNTYSVDADPVALGET